MPLGRIWSSRVNHMRWDDRLAFDNHHVSQILSREFVVKILGSLSLMCSGFFPQVAHSNLGFDLLPGAAISRLGEFAHGC